MATDYHYLMGADDVKDASYRMQQAATDMTNAAANFDQTIMNARNWANDWLVQYEQIQKEVSMDDKKVKRNLNRFAMMSDVEKQIRIMYQTIAYEACNAVDDILGLRAGHGITVKELPKCIRGLREFVHPDGPLLATIKHANSKPMTFLNVAYERRHQEKVWGPQNHDPHKWMSILTEECGEASEALLKENYLDATVELTQVAAVAIAMIESLQRNQL